MRGPSRRSDAFDVVRAVAAIAVVYGHAGQLVPNDNHSALGDFLTHHARAGVYLFFALSGYLICRPHIRALVSGAPLPDVRVYAIRRVARIVPAYWIALLAMLVVVRPVGTTGVGIVSHLLLIHDWIPGQAETILLVAWTLSIEAAFYVLVPLAAAAMRARSPRTSTGTLRRAVLLASLASALALLVPNPLSGDATQLVTENLPGTLVYFAPGIVVAVLETSAAATRRLDLAGRHRFALCGLAVALWVATSAASTLPSTLATALNATGVCTACGAVLLAARATPEVRSLPGRALRTVGTWSYGVYLWHWPVIG
ncbi:MAG TPA: acyltransferase, partial [Candidatus Dormibacteraeota bacterium]|nr:acyltransferase [Candidatus Dormibacteraeota bacterium]